MMHSWSRFRSYCIFVPLIFGYTLLMGILSLACSVGDRYGCRQHRCARIWSWLILKTSMCPVTAVGLERVRRNMPQVFAANHASAMDVPVLYMQLPVQFRIAANKNLFDYPFMGWHLRRSGQIAIDRTSMISTVKSFVRSVPGLRRNMNVLIFPEGRRSLDGNVQPFFRGAFYLAVKAQVPIVPLAIIGTYEMLPMNTYHIMPRRIELRVGEPIPTAGLKSQDVESLSVRVKDEIEKMLNHGTDPT
jgi:1-acyl-sn-glycerol-3-phosphate acyltransferase